MNFHVYIEELTKEGLWKFSKLSQVNCVNPPDSLLVMY